MSENCPKCGADSKVARNGTVASWKCGTWKEGNDDYGLGFNCLRRQLAQAKEIIDLLPKTADNMPIVPGMVVYYYDSPLGIKSGTITGHWDDRVFTERIGPPVGMRADLMYSTRAAATAAAKAKGYEIALGGQENKQ